MRAPAIVALFNATLCLASEANAAPPWVERRLVLSGEPVGGSVDVGVGFGHYEEPLSPGSTRTAQATEGALRVDAALGIASKVDIGLGFGVRSGGGPASDTAGYAQPDAYGRFYQPDPTYRFARGGNTLSNPELRVRGKLIDTGSFELGLEGRAAIPVTNGTSFATTFGVPMAGHIGHSVRIDFGVYNTIGFYDFSRPFVFDVPANFWFQVTDKVFLGPMTGVRFYSNWINDPAFDLTLGFGLGVHLARFADLKTQFVFPRVNKGAEYFGGGVGVGFVFE